MFCIDSWAREADDEVLHERDLDIIARGPPRPLPPRPLPKPSKRRSVYDDAMDVLARDYEDELFARWMEVDELD